MLKALTTAALALAFVLPVAAKPSQKAQMKAQAALKTGIEAFQKQPPDLQTAVASLTEAINSQALIPENLQIAYSVRGASYSLLKQCNLAVPDFNESLKMKPDAQIFAQRGLCEESLNQVPQAIADYKQAIALDPTQAGYYGKLCGTAYNAKMFADAAPACEVYVTKFEPQNKEITEATATAYEKIGNKKKANEWWKKLQALDPKSANAKAGVARTK